MTDTTKVEATTQELSLKTLRLSKTNPRRTLDPAKLKDLIASVKEKGVLVPLLVRPLTTPTTGRPVKGYSENGAHFEIVAGERRFRAAEKAGLETIPCLVRRLSDQEALEVQVIENLQREDVHPLDEGLGYRKLLDTSKYEVATLAAKVGKSESYVYQRLKLAELIPAAQKDFVDGKFTAGHAILIARLQPKDQEKTLKEMYDWQGNANSVRETADWIQRHLHLNLSKAAFSKTDAKLYPEAGSCVECPKRTKNQPQLFPDIQRGDFCTDPSCFQKKQSKHLAQMRAKLEAGGTKYVQISTDYRGGKGVLPNHDYTNAEQKKCPNRVTGLVVSGDGLGRTKRICITPGCKVHHPNYRGPETRPDWKKQQERQRLEDQAWDAVRGEVAAEFQKKAAFTQRDFPIVGAVALSALIENMDGDAGEALLHAHGLRVRGYIDPDELVRAFAKGWPRPKLEKLLAGALLAYALENPRHAWCADKLRKVDLKARVTAKVKELRAAAKAAKKAA